MPAFLESAALLAALTPVTKGFGLSQSKFMGLSSFAAWLQSQ
jgi:hypothetical protein